MHFLLDGLRDAWDLLSSGDHATYEIVWVTLKVALASTAIALVIGLPLGLALGLGRFRGRGTLMALANTGLGLPPVLVGLVVSLFLFRTAPLGGLHWIYTLRGVVAAQAILALPIVVALSAAAVGGVAPGLTEQARALGAGRLQVAALGLREARLGVLAAVIAALGAAFSEVGAVVLVGGNISGQTQTLASALLDRVGRGEYGRGIALGAILLGIVLVLSAALTVLQTRGAPRPSR